VLFAQKIFLFTKYEESPACIYTTMFALMSTQRALLKRFIFL